MKLLHGTCECNAKKILKEGLLANACLTSSAKVAEHYAKSIASDCEGCSGVFLSIECSESQLVVDYSAYDKPLSVYRNAHASDDEEWRELCSDGTIPYPVSHLDYKVALDITHRVKHLSFISANNVSLIE